MTRPSWVEQYEAAQPSDSAPNIVFLGNSMTEGTGSTDNATKSYPARTLARLGAPYVGTNAGIAGQSTVDIISGIAAQGIANMHLRARNTVCIWEGTNDLGGWVIGSYSYSSIDEVYEHLATLGAMCRAWPRTKVVALTVLPRTTPFTAPQATAFETYRGQLNTLIRAGWSGWADALVDVAADSRIGDSGDQSDATYYADTCHMTDAGYDLVASLVAPAILAL
jgi:lysophospholipase L1-like esterase